MPQTPQAMKDLGCSSTCTLGTTGGIPSNLPILVPWEVQLLCGFHSSHKFLSVLHRKPCTCSHKVPLLRGAGMCPPSCQQSEPVPKGAVISPRVTLSAFLSSPHPVSPSVPPNQPAVCWVLKAAGLCLPLVFGLTPLSLCSDFPPRASCHHPSP